MLTVWGRNNSSNVQIVLWCLEELEIPYERRDAGFTHGVVDTDEYALLNPNRLVPTIQDGDNPPMFESCAIARYLANNYGNDNYWPEDPIQRAQVDMWAEWSKLNVTSAFSIPLFWPIVRLDPALQNHKQLSTALAKLSKNLDIANDRLANNAFLVADQLTLADTVFGHMLYRYYDMDFDQANLSRPEHKHIRSYYDRLTQMEKYQKVVMIPYDELRFKS